MCRLYGFLANEPTKVDCSLVFAQNALLLQSRVDETGRDHADGWGIGTYSEGAPKVFKSPVAAFNDQAFSSTAEAVYSKAVIAHIRKATVGVPSEKNTHPFMFGNYVFAHNGTVTGFDSLQEQLLRETDAKLQATRAGTTDSELYFLWLLSRLKQERFLDCYSNELREFDPKQVEEFLRESVELLSKRCISADSTREPKLNFVLTDGTNLIACRWNNSLFKLRRHGIYECEICGIPHIHHHETVDHEAIVFASEPITTNNWLEVSNKTVEFYRFVTETTPARYIGE